MKWSELILTQHLTVPAKFLILAHLINLHPIRLRRNINNTAVSVFSFIIHGALTVAIEIIATLPVLPMGIKKDAETRDADSTKDAEDVALVLVELGRSFTAEDEKVVAEKGLDAGKAEMCEARAVVQEGVDPLWKSVRFLQN